MKTKTAWEAFLQDEMQAIDLLTIGQNTPKIDLPDWCDREKVAAYVSQLEQIT